MRQNFHHFYISKPFNNHLAIKEMMVCDYAKLHKILNYVIFHAFFVLMSKYIYCNSFERKQEGKHIFILKIERYKKLGKGIPWQPNDQDSALSLPEAQVQYLVGELKFHKSQGMAKTEIKLFLKSQANIIYSETHFLSFYLQQDK